MAKIKIKKMGHYTSKPEGLNEEVKATLTGLGLYNPSKHQNGKKNKLSKSRKREKAARLERQKQRKLTN